MNAETAAAGILTDQERAERFGASCRPVVIPIAADFPTFVGMLLEGAFDPGRKGIREGLWPFAGPEFLTFVPDLRNASRTVQVAAGWEKKAEGGAFFLDGGWFHDHVRIERMLFEASSNPSRVSYTRPLAPRPRSRTKSCRSGAVRLRAPKGVHVGGGPSGDLLCFEETVCGDTP